MRYTRYLNTKVEKNASGAKKCQKGMLVTQIFHI